MKGLPGWRAHPQVRRVACPHSTGTEGLSSGPGQASPGGLLHLAVRVCTLSNLLYNEQTFPCFLWQQEMKCLPKFCEPFQQVSEPEEEVVEKTLGFVAE